ncbi:hypothetical protein Q6241_30080, partial [Klebsiella pneumoniae]
GGHARRHAHGRRRRRTVLHLALVMLGFVLKRLATLVPTLVGITIVAFGLIRLVPGDPIEVMMGERRLDPEAHAALVKRMGLDQPLPVQY